MVFIFEKFMCFNNRTKLFVIFCFKLKKTTFKSFKLLYQAQIHLKKISALNLILNYR